MGMGLFKDVLAGIIAVVLLSTYFALINTIPPELIEKIINKSLLHICAFLFIFAAYISVAALRLNGKYAKEKSNKERFDYAIKQMNDQAVVARLAAIDTLKRLAIKLPKEYYFLVMDLLTAFIKERSPLPQKGDIPDNQDDAVLNDVKDLPLDIKTAVKVVGYFRKPRKKDEKHLIDLSGTDLKNITLLNADLRWINFEWTILRGAKLNGAKLKGADLDSADIRWADLTGTDLHRANLLDTKYNENTVFPKGFNPKSHNMLFLSMDNDP